MFFDLQLLKLNLKLVMYVYLGGYFGRPIQKFLTPIQKFRPFIHEFWLSIQKFLSFIHESTIVDKFRKLLPLVYPYMNVHLLGLAALRTNTAI